MPPKRVRPEKFVDSVHEVVDTVNMVASPDAAFAPIAGSAGDEDQTTRERLLGCALGIVSEGGVAKLGIREVARCAGVSHNAPSRHFPTHASLCTAVAAVGFERFVEDQETSLVGVTDPGDRMCAIAYSYVHFALDNRGLFDIMWRHDLVDMLDAKMLPPASRSFEILRECVAAYQNTGWNESLPTDEVAGFMWSWVHGLAQLWGSAAMPIYDMPTRLDQHVRTGIEILRVKKQEN